MCCNPIRDQHTLRTQDNDSPMHRSQMPPLNGISLNCLEDSDGCDGDHGCDGHDGYHGYNGHDDEFYGYTRIRQPNNTSTRHVRDEYGVQFRSSAGSDRVKIRSTSSEELGSTALEEFGSISASSGCVRSDFVTGQSVARQAARPTVWFG